MASVPRGTAWSTLTLDQRLKLGVENEATLYLEDGLREGDPASAFEELFGMFREDCFGKGFGKPKPMPARPLQANGRPQRWAEYYASPLFRAAYEVEVAALVVAFPWMADFFYNPGTTVLHPYAPRKQMDAWDPANEALADWYTKDPALGIMYWLDEEDLPYWMAGLDRWGDDFGLRKFGTVDQFDNLRRYLNFRLASGDPALKIAWDEIVRMMGKTFSIEDWKRLKFNRGWRKLVDQFRARRQDDGKTAIFKFLNAWGLYGALISGSMAFFGQDEVIYEKQASTEQNQANRFGTYDYKDVFKPPQMWIGSFEPSPEFWKKMVALMRFMRIVSDLWLDPFSGQTSLRLDEDPASSDWKKEDAQEVKRLEPFTPAPLTDVPGTQAAILATVWPATKAWTCPACNTAGNKGKTCTSCSAPRPTAPTVFSTSWPNLRYGRTASIWSTVFGILHIYDPGDPSTASTFGWRLRHRKDVAKGWEDEKIPQDTAEWLWDAVRRLNGDRADRVLERDFRAKVKRGAFGRATVMHDDDYFSLRKTQCRVYFRDAAGNWTSTFMILTDDEQSALEERFNDGEDVVICPGYHPGDEPWGLVYWLEKADKADVVKLLKEVLWGGQARMGVAGEVAKMISSGYAQGWNHHGDVRFLCDRLIWLATSMARWDKAMGLNQLMLLKGVGADQILSEIASAIVNRSLTLPQVRDLVQKVAGITIADDSEEAWAVDWDFVATMRARFGAEAERLLSSEEIKKSQAMAQRVVAES